MAVLPDDRRGRVPRNDCAPSWIAPWPYRTSVSPSLWAAASAVKQTLKASMDFTDRVAQKIMTNMILKHVYHF
jgi:hypothetical protein